MSIQRQNATVQTRAISAFWRWWSAEGVGLLSGAVTTGDYRDLPDMLDGMVKAIGPGLGWETGPGVRARHQFCVSGGGDPGLRVLAERWRRAAPPSTPMWEFAGARQPQPGMLAVTIEAAGKPINLGLARVSVTLDEERARAHVSLHHPAFTALSPGYQYQLSCLLLDWLLGEDHVQGWIGTINAAETEPPDSLPATDLPEIINAMTARHARIGWPLKDAGTDRARSSEPCVLSGGSTTLCWTCTQPSKSVTRRLARRATGLRRSDRPALARRGPGSSPWTRGLLVATQTSNGRRVLHYYTDPEDQNGRDTMDRFAGTRPDVEVTHTHDPGWTLISPLT